MGVILTARCTDVRINPREIEYVTNELLKAIYKSVLEDLTIRSGKSFKVVPYDRYSFSNIFSFNNTMSRISIELNNTKYGSFDIEAKDIEEIVDGILLTIGR